MRKNMRYKAMQKDLRRERRIRSNLAMDAHIKVEELRYLLADEILHRKAWMVGAGILLVLGFIAGRAIP
jgi:hypothetical protein